MSNDEEKGDSYTARISAAVRSFYDAHPYPPPVDDLDGYRRLWDDPQKRRADFHLFWPAEPFREDRSILIAGCGTSQAAKHALRWPKAHITGIDLSATSVRYTQELTRRYDLKNLEIRQLAVESAAELGRRFDQVVCTGVLHHLPDPDAGLRALRGVLEPGGAMHLMVYAPYGRTGVYMMQEYCRRLGIRATMSEIADLQTSIQALPRDHPLAHLFHKTPDFGQKAGLADALLHPQDRPYSVPQLFDFIRRNGLTFGRWQRQAPYLPQCGILAGVPHASRLLRLPMEEQYAAVELFRGTMVQHNAILYRNERPSEGEPIRFDRKDWENYVPIRMPATISVQERLPLGAAAVLINRSHTYTDLYLPIDGHEKKLFDAIDGKSTIAELASRAPSGPKGEQPAERARSLFERLWWYDQVVFDASKQNRGNLARA